MRDERMKHLVNESRRKRRQGGNALIEFALCSTVLMMFACGITDFSRLFNLANMAVGAASAGIQYGALSPSNYGDLSGMRTAALNDTGNYTGASATATQFCTCSVGGAQVTCPASCGSGVTGQTYIQLVVTVPYQAIFSYPGVPNPINVTQLACARVE